MCKYLQSNEQCAIRLPHPDGSRDIESSMAIRKAFDKASQKSPYYDAKRGTACGSYRCCFVAGKYASWEDCPFFEI